jgi:hypothetical protein
VKNNAWQPNFAAQLAAGALFIGICAACCSSPSYRGDGTITRHGFGADVDLGPIDLSKQGHFDYSMEGLSPCEMVVGFRTAQRHLDAVVRMTLANDRGETVVAERGPLQSWVWTEPGYFVYQRGEDRDIPIPGQSSVRVERVGVRADGGWGSYFTPVRTHRYRLAIDVEHTATVEAPQARVSVECLRGSL